MIQDDDDLFEDDFDLDDFEDDFDDEEIEDVDLDDEDLGDESWNDYDDAAPGETASDGVQTIPEAEVVVEDEPEDFDELPDDFEDENEDGTTSVAHDSAESPLKKYFYPIVGGVVAVVGVAGYMAFAPSSEPVQQPGFPAMDLAQDMQETQQDDIIEQQPTIDNTRQQVSLAELLEAEEATNNEQFGTLESSEQDVIEKKETNNALTPMPNFGEDPVKEVIAEVEDVIDPVVEEAEDVAEDIFKEIEEVPSTFAELEDSAEVLEEENLESEKKVDTPQAVEQAPVLSKMEIVSLLEPVSKEAENLRNEIKSTLSNLENKDRNFERGLSNIEKELSNKIENTDKKLERILSSLEAMEKKLEEAAKQPKEVIRIVEKNAPKKTMAEETRKESSLSAQKKPEPVLKPKTTPSSKTPDWYLRSAQPGSAILGDRNSQNTLSIKIGDRVQGVGRVTSIAIINGKWVVSGTENSVSQ